MLAWREGEEKETKRDKSQYVREDAFSYDFSYDLMYQFYISRNIGIVVAMLTCMYGTKKM